MNLPKKALNELKDLRIYYEEKERQFDIDFLVSCYDILNSTNQLKNKITFGIDEDNGISAFEENGVITVSLREIEKQAKEVLDVFIETYDEDSKYRVINLFAILTMIHEASHVVQDLGLDEDDQVNKFYAAISKRGLLNRIFSPFSGFYSFERHANIDAHKALIDIYDDSTLGVIPKTFYLDLILYLYGIFSPTEKTQILFLLPEHFAYDDLSVMKRLEVGFPVDKEIIKLIDNELIREARGETDFYECKMRILGITNGTK